MGKFFRHSLSISNRDGQRIPMHVVDRLLGKGENPGMLIRSAGKQLYDPDDGSLAGAWLMDEQTGLFVRDHGNSQSHGLITGADWNVDGLTFIRANTDRIAVGNGFNYDKFTIIVWINSTASSATNTIFGKWGSNYFFYFNASGHMYFYDSDSVAHQIGITDIADGDTNLIAVVINGAESRGYLNGASDGDKFLPALDYASNSDGYIGAYGSGTSNNYDGIMYLFAIYLKALTTEEIKAIYDIGLYRRTESYRIANA